MDNQPLCHKMKIPVNLGVILHQLARDIIYKQPQDIYGFAADFFERLIEERNNSKLYTFLNVCVYTIFILTLLYCCHISLPNRHWATIDCT